MGETIENVMAAIDYMEDHLSEKIDLEILAHAVHYSKFHLHHMFTNTVGISIQTYAQRRRLTEAAKRLVFSDQPILDIALLAGYESQQSFSSIFKAMYKKSPGQYRDDQAFYPLQLPYVLNKHPASLANDSFWYENISYALFDDIPLWMDLVHLVIDGFPHLNEEDYVRRLKTYICRRQALILKDQNTAVGIMIFTKETGSIDFLGVHPQYRKTQITWAFLKRAFHELANIRQTIAITTFREGDKADIGYRNLFKNLGFAEAELLIEFGYPTQRFVLQKTILEEKRMNNPLSQSFHAKSLILFAFPTIATMVFMGLYTITDTIFVSRFVNTNALSALNIICPVINLIVGLGTMLGTGGSAIIARKMGAGDHQRARSDFTLIILTGFLAGTAAACLGILFIDHIIKALGANQVLFPYCREYLFVLLLFTPASILQVLFQNLIVTAGRPGLGMILAISAGIINILFDFIFMALLHLGIKGAALGTGIGYLLPALVGFGFFSRSKGSLYFQKPVIDLSVLAESCGNGFSEMISQASSAVTTFFFNIVMMDLLGENGVAAITIMIYTQFLLTTLYIGFSMGVAPVISYNYGCHNHQQLKNLFCICTHFIAAVSAAVFLLSMVFASPLAAVFSPKNTLVYQIARKGFFIFPFSFLFCGFNIFTSAMLTALSNGKLSACLSFLRTFGLITLALLILPGIMGVFGVWLAVPAAELITFIISLVLGPARQYTR